MLRQNVFKVFVFSILFTLSVGAGAPPCLLKVIAPPCLLQAPPSEY